MTRIPGDLDRPDTFLLGLNLRQLALLAPVFALVAGLGWLGAGRMPLVALMAVLATISGAGISLTLIRQDGMAPDALAQAFLAQLRRPKHLVHAPEGMPQIPRRLRVALALRVGEFKEPWRGLRGGDVDLGDRLVRVLAVSSLDLQLRSERETRALTEGFGRLLNALDDSLSVVVRGEPIDLEDRARRAEVAGGAGSGALAAYGADHAGFLRSMSGGLRRQVYLVLGGADADQLDARCSEVLSLLVPLRLSANRLEGSEVVALLARACGVVVPHAAQVSPGAAVTGQGGRHGVGA